MGSWRPNPFGLPEAERLWQQDRKQQATAEQTFEASSDDRFNTQGNPNLMGSEYFKDKDQMTWADDAAERYGREHGIDMQYGGITGPLGPIPSQIAPAYQAAHDQAVWNARNRMAREALRFGQGAAGLMSSYRAGGGAAILSNQHGNLANIQMQRAQMMQPLDLLGDYRRDQMARAGSAGRSESQWGAALQGIGAILSVAVPGVGTIAGAALAAGGGMLAAQGAGKAQAAFAKAGAVGYGGGAGAQAGTFGAALQMAQGIRQMGSGGYQSPGTDQYGTPLLSPRDRAMAEQSTRKDEILNGNLSGQTGSGRFIDDPQAQTFGAQSGDQGGTKNMGAAAGRGAQAGAMGGMGIVGQNGDFTPTAYASNGMTASPYAPAAQYVLNQRMAQNIEQDPSWAMFSMAIDRELVFRTGPSAQWRLTSMSSSTQ